MIIRIVLICILFQAQAVFCAKLSAFEPEGAAGAALLWIPAEGSGSDWEPVLDAISQCPDFHVTIAVGLQEISGSRSPLRSQRAVGLQEISGSRSPLRSRRAIPSISRSGISKLKMLVSNGQVEAAMRLSGDPVLPLLFYPNNPNVWWENRPDAVLWPDRPDEMASRLSAAQKKYIKIFKDSPAGWVPAAGGIVPESLPIARALGLKWIATGAVENAREIFNISGVSLVPFTWQPPAGSPSPEAEGMEDFEFDDESANAGFEEAEYEDMSATGGHPCFLVFDESLGPGTNHEVRSRFISVINSSTFSLPAMRWLTVSQTISESQPSPEAEDSPASADLSGTGSPSPEAEDGTAAAIFPWTGDYTLWTKVPAQITALANLNRTRQAYNSYINSGQANWKILRRVTKKFLSMESGERLLRMASPDPEISREAQREFETGLANIYKQIGKPVPPSLSHGGFAGTNPPPKARTKPEVFTQTEASSPEQRLPGRLESGTTAFVTIKSGRSWITIENADKQLNIPDPLPALQPGADPYKIWKLDSLRIAWDDDEFRICFAPAQIDNSDNAPAGFGHLLIDLYIDMNHRLGSGMLSLLEGRKIRTAPEDAWEYALTVNGWKANLFKAGSSGPVLIGSYMPRMKRRTGSPPTADLSGSGTASQPSPEAEGEIYVVIPRKLIRGNPFLWGYMAAVMATVPGGVHDEPQGVPFIPDSGEPLIDVLASERIKGSLYSLRLPK